MTHFYRNDNRSALEAISEAQRIAFAPFIFQASVALRDLGILSELEQAKAEGCSVSALATQLELSNYGVSVLLDAGLSYGLVWQDDSDHFHLTKVGYFLLRDEMTRVNMDFTRDFCYAGLQSLKESVVSGRPEGLSVFNTQADTLYPLLSSLPEPAKSSWFSFDHFYSDRAFDEALPVVFERKPKLLFDIGGNTGKWALACVKYDPDVRVRILDLPPQLAVMKTEVKQAGYADRIDGHAVDLLSDQTVIPAGADAVWMSQFLDCFSKEQINQILGRVNLAVDSSARLYILETCWDKQQFEAASFSLNSTSLYFTCFANGQSRMYCADDLVQLIAQAGFEVEQTVENIGVGHTLFVCKKVSDWNEA